MTGAVSRRRTQEVALYRPELHAGQRAVFAHPARLKWIVAGRRWRKTSLCLYFAIEGILAKEHVLWTAPTYDQCRIGWDELRKAAQLLIKYKLAVFNRSLLEATFINGGKIRFRSMDDPDNARGYTASRIIMDEAPHCREEAWTEVLRPVISDTLGRAMLVGTPNGRNWFWRELMRSIEGLLPDSMGWQIPTKGFQLVEGQLVRRPSPLENPDFPEREAFAMLDSMPAAVFRQEFLAEFLEDELGVFRNVDALVGDYVVLPPEPDGLYIAGIDWGKHHDYTAVSVVDARSLRVVYAERWNQTDYLYGLEKLKALHKNYQFKRMVAELNAMGEPMVELMFRAGLPVRPFVTTNASKAEIIEALALASEQRSVTLPNNPELLDEMKAFKMFRTPTGMVRYAAPEGYHDDLVISTAFAWSGMATPADEIITLDSPVHISPW